LFANDGIILCDTSIAPVTMTLLEIPAGYWQTTWKLYVLDNNNNAGTHSITISVPVGYTINNASTLVINTNGGGVTITIASNTAFFGQVSPIPSGGGSGTVTGITFNSPLTGGTINVSGNAGITQATTLVDGYISAVDWTRFDDKTTIQTGLDPATNITKVGRISFNSASFQITNPVVNVANVKMFDTGWVDLLGFAWIDAAYRPKCRRYGNAIYFKGNAVVPMEDPSNPANLYQPYGISTEFYERVDNSTTYFGAGAGGVVIDPAGAIIFNNDSPVLPTSVYDPSLFDNLDSSYYTGWKPCYRRFYCNTIVPPTPAATQEVSVTTVLNAYLDNTGKLRCATIFDIENGLGLDGLIGSSTFRMLTPSIIQGDTIPNYIARNATTGENAQVGSVNSYQGGSDDGDPSTSNEIIFSGANLNILTVTSVPTGQYIQGGQTILTAGFPANTFIRHQLTGVSGGAGTYQISWAGNYVGASSVLLLNPSLNALMQTGVTPYGSTYTPLASTTPYKFPFDMDGSRPTQLGGVVIDLSGLVAFINPKTY
jgi:hypothetical protein